MTDFDGVCLACRLSRHAECTVALAEDLPPGEACCCGGTYDRAAHLRQISSELRGTPAPIPLEDVSFASEPPAAMPMRGDSGYIHPDAWTSTRDIGTFTDVESTGRKRVTSMYPLSGGQVCDWANLKNCGGGPKPIIGCMGNPASDLHHGPDKNTLNNEKGSRGVGAAENVHAICSFCHTNWHAKNDAYYPPYDRNADQARPWLPVYTEPWGGHSPEIASFEELTAEAKRRDEQARNSDKDTRGRNSQPRVPPNTAVSDE